MMPKSTLHKSIKRINKATAKKYVYSTEKRVEVLYDIVEGHEKILGTILEILKTK